MICGGLAAVEADEPFSLSLNESKRAQFGDNQLTILDSHSFLAENPRLFNTIYNLKQLTDDIGYDNNYTDRTWDSRVHEEYNIHKQVNTRHHAPPLGFHIQLYSRMHHCIHFIPDQKCLLSSTICFWVMCLCLFIPHSSLSAPTTMNNQYITVLILIALLPHICSILMRLIDHSGFLHCQIGVKLD